MGLRVEYSGATPENEMKWSVNSRLRLELCVVNSPMTCDREIIEPFQNVFNFTPGDTIRDFARAHDYTLRGHTLVWHKCVAIEPFFELLFDAEPQPSFLPASSRHSLAISRVTNSLNLVLELEELTAYCRAGDALLGR